MINKTKTLIKKIHKIYNPTILKHLQKAKTSKIRISKIKIQTLIKIKTLIYKVYLNKILMITNMMLYNKNK